MDNPNRTRAPEPGQSQYQTGDGEGGAASGDGTPASAFDRDMMTPDTGIAGQSDPLIGIDSGEDSLAANRSAEATREDAKDDPLSQTGTYEGKRVFRANELNQAGEDKEYFHPKDDHRFSVPTDATHHDLTPDVVLTPGTKPQVELKTNK